MSSRKQYEAVFYVGCSLITAPAWTSKGNNPRHSSSKQKSPQPNFLHQDLGSILLKAGDAKKTKGCSLDKTSVRVYEYAEARTI